MSINLARENFDEFAELVLVDEKSGKAVAQQWFHELWTQLREKHDRLIICSAVGLGKSQQNTIAYVVWLLGRNPRLRIAIVSKTQPLARQFADACAKLIESSPVVREIFPNLRPGDKWSTDHRFIDRPPGIAGPSILPLGVDGTVTGFRLDVVIMDDVVDLENSRIKSRQDKVYDWVDKTLLNRLEPEGSRVVICCNAWDPNDPNERFGKREDWTLYRFPLEVTPELLQQFPMVGLPKDEGGLGLKLGQTVWPGRFPQSVVNKLRRTEVTDFRRARLCQPKDASDARFDRGWINAALERGRELPVCETLGDFLAWDDPDALDLDTDDLGVAETDDFWIIHGVDLSAGESKDSDLSAIVTIAVCVYTHKRFLLRVVAGRWQAPEIQERIIDTHKKFGGFFMVENNGTQGFIRQMLVATTAIPIYRYTTGWTKSDPSKGIELIAQELAQGKWVLPGVGEGDGIRGADEDIEELCADLVDYAPKVHTGDRAMALWFAQILALRMGRKFGIRKEEDSED